MTSLPNFMRTMAVTAILGTLSMSAPPTSWPQEKPAPNIQPAPTTVPGRPDIPNAEVAKTLRGVPQPPFATPAEKLQIGQLKMP
ncbi:MAG: hypothetical protein ACXW5W_24365, partial [Candidatus Binatia bacterium]